MHQARHLLPCFRTVDDGVSRITFEDVGSRDARCMEMQMEMQRGRCIDGCIDGLVTFSLNLIAEDG